MKTLPILVAGCLLCVAGILLGFVSARHYGFILLFSLILEAGALACLIPSMKAIPRFSRPVVWLGIIAAGIGILDNLLRLVLKTRISDLF